MEAKMACGQMKRQTRNKGRNDRRKEQEVSG